MPRKTSVEEALGAIEEGRAPALFVVHGDPVIGEPVGRRIADALAARSGCPVEVHRRPPTLGPILQDLRTFSLFASAKVALVVDSAVVADRQAAAGLIDDADKGLPITDPEAPLAGAGREAASRLLQALRVFGIDPAAGDAESVIAKLPDWALTGGVALRKRRPRGRPAKERRTLVAGLSVLLEAARLAGLVGYAEGDLAELGIVAGDGLPEGHALVLVEATVATDHPLVARVAAAAGVLDVGRVEAGRGGEWQGLQNLIATLERETGVGMAPDAARELARRTLKQTGNRNRADAKTDSTSRFAAEYRKLASLVGQGTIGRQAVQEAVDDRGDEDVWQILGALGEGRGDEASARFSRLLGSADDLIATRLSFFGLLAGFCRQLTAVVGMMQAGGVRPGERNYHRFKSSHVPALQGALPDGSASPLAGLHPFRLHKAYLAASRLHATTASQLPWWVLETEQLVKGGTRDPDAAIAALISRVATAVRGR